MDISASDRIEGMTASQLPPQTSAEIQPSLDKSTESERARDLIEEPPRSSWGQYLRHRPWLVAAGFIGLLLCCIAGLLWWLQLRKFETTDDAFIDADTIAISFQVAGAISELNVNDNQSVDYSLKCQASHLCLTLGPAKRCAGGEVAAAVGVDLDGPAAEQCFKTAT